MSQISDQPDESPPGHLPEAVAKRCGYCRRWEITDYLFESDEGKLTCHDCLHKVPPWGPTKIIQPVIIQKHCPRCDQDLPVASFYVNHARKDGRDNYCQVCRKAYNASRRPTSG